MKRTLFHKRYNRYDIVNTGSKQHPCYYSEVSECRKIVPVLIARCRAFVAQWLEHWSCKPGVESSNLSEGFSEKKSFLLCPWHNSKIGLLVFSRVAQRKRAGPITQRSVDRNHPLLRTHFRPSETNWNKYVIEIYQDALSTSRLGRCKWVRESLMCDLFVSDAGSRTLGLAHPKRESYHMTKWSSWPWCFGSLKSETDKARIKNASKIDAHFGMTRWPSG